MARESQSLEALWFLMHQSVDPRKLKLAVTCYCDDSGSHEESEVAVVGGTVMNKQGFIDLNYSWRKVLREFRIDSIHMQDFVRPHGRYSTISPEMKKALFITVAKTINDTKIYSISVAVPQVDYKALFSKQVYREFMGAYAMAFLGLVIANHDVAVMTGYNNRIAYLVDKGSQHHHEQLEGAHGLMLKIEKERSQHFTGPMTSDLDDNNYGLQAADVVAWAYHRTLESDDFGEEFLPLLAIFAPHQGPRKKRPHIALPIPTDGIAIFANLVNKWLAINGTMPTWADFLAVGPNGSPPLNHPDPSQGNA